MLIGRLVKQKTRDVEEEKSIKPLKKKFNKKPKNKVCLSSEYELFL